MTEGLHVEIMYVVIGFGCWAGQLARYVYRNDQSKNTDLRYDIQRSVILEIFPPHI